MLLTLVPAARPEPRGDVNVRQVDNAKQGHNASILP